MCFKVGDLVEIHADKLAVIVEYLHTRNVQNSLKFDVFKVFFPETGSFQIISSYEISSYDEI